MDRVEEKKENNTRIVVFTKHIRVFVDWKGRNFPIFKIQQKPVGVIVEILEQKNILIGEQKKIYVSTELLIPAFHYTFLALFFFLVEKWEDLFKTLSSYNTYNCTGVTKSNLPQVSQVPHI